MTDLEHIMLLQKWLEESYEKNKKLDEQNKKVTWHFRHTKGKWMKHGQTGERERIIAILKSYAPHLITDGLMQLISARTHENQEQK